MTAVYLATIENAFYSVAEAKLFYKIFLIFFTILWICRSFLSLYSLDSKTAECPVQDRRSMLLVEADKTLNYRSMKYFRPKHSFELKSPTV